MTDQALDELVRRLLRDAARQDYAALLAEAPEHSFSPAFERRMKKLIRRTDHPVRHRLAQTAACLLLAALLSGCSLLAFSPTARNALAGWVREVFSSWSVYHHSGDPLPTPEDAVYRPSWVPPAYEELVPPETGTFVRTLYETAEGDLLGFFYLTASDSTTLTVEWEGAVVRPVTIGDLSGELYQNPEEGPNILVWADAEKDVVFWLTAPLEEDELVKVAASVERFPVPKRYCISWLPMEYGGGFFVADERTSEGKGETVYEGNDELTITFGYSNDRENDPPYPEKDGPMEPIQVGDAPAALYRAQEEGGQHLLVWDNDDGSVVLWVRAAIPEEMLVQIGESVIPDLNTLASTMEISTFEPEDELLEEVTNALTSEFIAQVKAYARRDAAAEIYMQPDYIQMVRSYKVRQLSPQRTEAIARITPQIERLMKKGTPGEHVLSLFGPFYSASIFVSYHLTTAHICNEYGEMIAGYRSDCEDWIIVPTKAEMQFSYEVTQIYADAYRAARAALAAN